MENLTLQDAEELMAYYRDYEISSEFSEDKQTLNIKVKNDVDIEKAAKGAEVSWYDQGEYPMSFTGVLKTEDGSKTATFEYEASGDYIFGD
ncbi:hypothetical protein [Pedobacter zeae]|uniref:Uncharacterized protein n=1 Tax=Pedobacter zeae TaxID=1737356 RepID=A0A7W6KBX0_9SPHI|nr:hypothetical protein [Pedobacter zeae]MBB4107762.1 hypothetical protein [Pedobacter zeae]GGG97217.1 hypothetical protein GCM10007422_08920 [Pedobacter zeae]